MPAGKGNPTSYGQQYEEAPQPQQRGAPQGSPHRSSSGSGIWMIFLSLVFIIGPYLIPMAGINVPATSQIILTIFGAALFTIGGILLIITRLYHRARADHAFVRTGMGGCKVILDGGAIVVPVVHEVVWVSLRTMRFEVTRSGASALITSDCLRADITAEFFIKIQKAVDAVRTAATSLGTAAMDPYGVQQVLDKKLESALRQVAAEMGLQDLLANRAKFIEAVKGHVGSDIANNGLVLESVTISRLDQTPTTDLRPEENIFDAQGARKITEITTGQNVARNQLTLEAQRRIEQEKVGTDKFLYEQQVARESAAADRDRQIKVAQATAAQEAATKAAEQDRLARIAEVERDRQIQLAEVAQAKSVEVAGQEREQAVQQAEIAKDQAVQVAERNQQIAVTERDKELEVARRAREIAIADKEKELATAKAAQLEAEASREAAQQKVVTVQVTATAERDKAKAVIGAQADAEKEQVRQKVGADAAAYALVAKAQGEQDAAARQAQARLALAEADKQAKILAAEGAQAEQMVPVAVRRQEVDVNAAQVAVERQSLANQAEYQEIAKVLQIELAKIAAEREVRIESARAMGVALSSARMTIWGDPAAVARMTEAFYRGQGMGQFVNGVATSTPPEVKEFAQRLAAAVQEKLGLPVSAEVVQELLEHARKPHAASQS